MKLGLKCTKLYRLDGYTPAKCFSNFVQSALKARRQGDNNLNSSVIIETVKLLANNLYGYQKMDRRRHPIKVYEGWKDTFSDEQKLLERLGHFNDQLYLVELAKSETEH